MKFDKVKAYLRARRRGLKIDLANVSKCHAVQRPGSPWTQLDSVQLPKQAGNFLTNLAVDTQQ